MGSPTLGILEWFRPGEEARVERALDALDRIGVRHLRTGVSWAEWLTPEGRGWYEWLMPKLASRLEDVLPCFSYVPPSLSEPPGTNVPPTRLESYGEFVCYFIELFGDAFEWVELWNEPDNHREWNAAFDPDYAKFAYMMGHAGQWARKLGKKTLLGGLANADPNFLSMLHEAGSLDHFDAVGVHGFPFSFEFYWEGWPARVQRLRERLDWCGHKDTPIWITEAGYSTWRNDPLPQVTTFADAMKAPAERLYWYSLDDLDPSLPTVDGFHSDEREYHFGLRTADGLPKLLDRLLEAGTPADAAAFGHRLEAQPAVEDGYHLVIGGCGRAGFAIAHDLAGRGERVACYDNLSGLGSVKRAAKLMDAGVRIEVADVLDEHRLLDLTKPASSVVHAAFLLDADLPSREFDVNARGTLNVLLAARQSDKHVDVRLPTFDGNGTTAASLKAAKAYIAGVGVASS